MKVALARLEAMPDIVEQMVKPAEKIDSIKIHQVSGLGQGGVGGTAAGDKPVVNQALDSILGMAVQMPALQKLGQELGLSMENGLAAATSDALNGESEEPKPAAIESDKKPDKPKSVN